jgi:serine/threonine-protein kinase
MSTGDGQGDGLAPGTLLGRYEIRRQLGRGGMGAVYEAIHRDLKKRVAVKVLMPQLASNEEARQRFLREGEAASRIRHPHVVDVTDVGGDGTLSYLVMEFLEGEDLAGRLARGPLSPQEAADILLPVVAGVAAAHDEGVVHRDLKPENIFLSRQKHGGLHPKVLDFGISKVSGGSGSMALTGTAATFGTPFYMPPEQLRGARQADHRSDQYALGVVLYECVVGRRPFEADNIYAMLRAIGDGDYPLPRVLRPDLPESLELVIVRAMRLDPAQRFDTTRDFGAALLPFASDHSRLLWSSTFGAPESASVPPGMARTLALPQESDPGRYSVPTRPRTGSGTGGSVSGTRIMPSTNPPAVSRAPSAPPPHTTLGSATGQRLGLTVRPRRRGPGLMIGGVLVAGGIAAGVVFFLGKQQEDGHKKRSAVTGTDEGDKPAARPATYRVDVEADPPAARIELDGMPVGEGLFRRELPLDGRSHRLVARAAGYEDADVQFIDHPPPPRLVLKQLPPPPRPAADETAKAQPPAHAEHVEHAEKDHKGSKHHHGGGGGTPPAAATTPATTPVKATTPATGPQKSANDSPVID